MKHYLNRYGACTLTITAIASLALTPARAGERDASNPDVLDPRSCAYDSTYAQWSVRFWQWALKLPATHHPLFDTADLSTGQSGPVWFLGGKFCATTPGAPPCNPQVADRSGTIPEGVALFFPMINGEASTVEGNGTNYIDLRNTIQPEIDLVDTSTLACEMDGKPIKDLDQYRVLSPLFTYALASHDNVWAATGETTGNQPVPIPDGATTQAVSDGYYILLAPPPPGKHTLHFHAAIPAFGFSLDVTYHLTVAGRDLE